MIPDFRIKSGGKPAIANIEEKTSYAERIRNGIKMMKELEKLPKT